MDLSAFLTELIDSGRPTVSPESECVVDDRLVPVLEEIDAAQRANLAWETPEFSPAASIWAVIIVYRACQLVVCRDIDADTAVKLLSEPCPERHSASTDYSVDLVFRYLPEIAALASHIAPADTLVKELVRLGNAWPLSSVGMPGVDQFQIDAFFADPALRQLYIDRIMEKGDRSRLAEERVKLAVAADLGSYPELAANLRTHLEVKSK
jgi:hypothetical protein